jgi:predicted RNA-binding protein
MNYWLFVITVDNWRITEEKKTVGVAERHRHAISRVQRGDRCLLYIKANKKGTPSEPSIAGAYEVISDFYRG